jgi:hypothetical protein
MFSMFIAKQNYIPSAKLYILNLFLGLKYTMDRITIFVIKILISNTLNILFSRGFNFDEEF